MPELKEQKLVIEFESSDALIPFILRKLNDALLKFESVQKPRMSKVQVTKVAESKISPQWSTTIPAEVRPWLKADKGDEMEWHVENGKVEVVKKREVSL